MDNPAFTPEQLQQNKLVSIKQFEKKNSGNLEENDAKKMNSIRLRNFIGFWLLGLSNNFAYVIMLSAAHDILDTKKAEDEICNPISTSVILLLDIVPSLIVKMFAPFILGYASLKVIIVIVFTVVSFLLTGLELGQGMAFVGVVFASLASGLGEVTFLGYMSKFEANSISAWSSGTGAAGFFGALSYFALTYVLTPKHSILTMLVMPLVMWLSFFVIVVPEDDSMSPLLTGTASVEEQQQQQQQQQQLQAEQEPEPEQKISLSTKFSIFRGCLKFMVPLALIYLFEYFINQGLSELVYFRNSVFNHKQQYRFYQAEYQFGVLISRSSINFVKIDRIWILAVLQGLNVVVFLAHILHPFLAAFWIASCFVLFEGLLGGAGYVNTFYKLRQTNEIAPNHKEFALSVTSLADTLGITISAFSAIPVHNLLCAYMKQHY